MIGQMTRLLLAHQLFDFPNDAITQFGRHIRNYRSSVGVAEREFEHWTWMCRQYQVFGELLEKTYATSTNSGPLAFVPSLQSPAYYFEHAAILALRRKKHAKRMAERTFPRQRTCNVDNTPDHATNSTNTLHRHCNTSYTDALNRRAVLKASPAFDKFTREKSEWIRSPYLGHPATPAQHPLDPSTQLFDHSLSYLPSYCLCTHTPDTLTLSTQRPPSR